MNFTLIVSLLLLTLGCVKKDPNVEIFNEIEGGSLSDVKSVLKDGADINARKGKLMFTPLIYASTHGKFAMAAHFIDLGADVNLVDKQKRNALIWAVWKGHVEIVKMLLENEANIQQQTASGSFPITFAKKYKRTEILEILTEAGAHENINPED